MKRSKPWAEDLEGAYVFDTNKGIILIHLQENGYLEIEALLYDKYPYKQEILDLFYKKPKKNINRKKSLSFENLASLDNYFNGLIDKDICTVILD